MPANAAGFSGAEGRGDEGGSVGSGRGAGLTPTGPVALDELSGMKELPLLGGVGGVGAGGGGGEAAGEAGAGGDIGVGTTTVGGIDDGDGAGAGVIVGAGTVGAGVGVIVGGGTVGDGIGGDPGKGVTEEIVVGAGVGESFCVSGAFAGAKGGSDDGFVVALESDIFGASVIFGEFVGGCWRYGGIDWADKELPAVELTDAG